MGIETDQLDTRVRDQLKKYAEKARSFQKGYIEKD